MPDPIRRQRSPRTPARSSRAEQNAGRALALCDALLSEQGEVSGRRIAAFALSAYQSLDQDAREIFFDRLAVDFAPDAGEVDRAAARYRLDASSANLIRLQAAVESPRQELFRRANMAPGGTAVLLEMRRELLKTLGSRPERAGIDADLIHLFRSWFNRGFLVLQRIDWHTPAVILERLIHYEAVHEIQGWRDLRRRLEGDRRCYAFFHPVLPDEPLVFIEIALTRGMTAAVQPLLDPDSRIGDAAEANCAIFYSITNCQDGLRGVSFGHFLIKQVVDDLGRDLPRLKTFATISPIPGFREWLGQKKDDRVRSPELDDLLAGVKAGTMPDVGAISPSLRKEITAQCVEYLLRARRDDAPLDAVARFHLANGARLERLNWMGDPSKAGIRRALGLMVNYVYRVADLERNHEAYAKHGKVVASPRFGRSVRAGER
ncbi:MAG TPA: malonyl-CoA decarboxylase [Vicinamibacterales bacterium]